MKYNPKINEEIASLNGFTDVHPYQPSATVQGVLQLLFELERALCAITGMSQFALSPAAGAHGELCGMMMTKAYHTQRGETKRTKVIVPDSSHGTNPASAGLYGYDVVQIASNKEGCIDVAALRRIVDDRTACLMLTNPNTLGLFEEEILAIATLVHERGGLLYYDGANMNALLGIARPRDMGFDIVHLNLHKTFSTPHGGGGPGAGPIGVCERLVDYLPAPLITCTGEEYHLTYDMPHSIGKVKLFHGNVGLLIRAYAYIRAHGAKGLTQVSHDAILNANYLRKELEQTYEVPYGKYCMHEFVASAKRQNAHGVTAGDIAKRLLDYGCYAPTVYFPLIVKEALMIEPTETESKATLDEFVRTLRIIAEEAETQPAMVKHAPHRLPVKRVDEVKAARELNVRYDASVPAKEPLHV